MMPVTPETPSAGFIFVQTLRKTSALDPSRRFWTPQRIFIFMGEDFILRT